MVQRIIDQALKRIPSEPYAELRPVLETFVGGVQDAVETNFVGAYLVGSLATGDFDHDSDIDFLIVTDEELTDAQVQSLQALHLELHSLGCYPAQHLEGSYHTQRLVESGGSGRDAAALVRRQRKYGIRAVASRQ
jgi:predicted nucleotidyltransferase